MAGCHPAKLLDGFKVVEGLLPEDLARQWKQLEHMGISCSLSLYFLYLDHPQYYQ